MTTVKVFGVSCLLALGACASEARQELSPPQDTGPDRPPVLAYAQPMAALVAAAQQRSAQPAAPPLTADATPAKADAMLPHSAATAVPVAHQVAQPGLQAEPASDADDDTGCQRGILEPDLFALPLDGPGVSAGAVQPGSYLVSSTYLRLQHSDAASSQFWELMAPIFDDLATRDGLVALSLALSIDCNSARTLSVWRDEEAMLDFVVSPAHGAATAAISKLSRGGSTVTHWTGDETRATWDIAAQQLANDDGPFY